MAGDGANDHAIVLNFQRFLKLPEKDQEDRKVKAKILLGMLVN
jgi:hypothetical protein